MGLLSGIANIFGGGGTSSTNASGTTSSQFDQTTQQEQSQTQSMEQQQLLQALQQVLGSGQTQQQMQYGLAPQDQYATMGQQGMLSNLLQGYQNTPIMQGLGTAAAGTASTMPNYYQMAFDPANSQGYKSVIGGMTTAAENLYNTLMKPQIDANYTKSGMFGSTPWAREQAQGASSLSANLGGQAAGVMGQQQQIGAGGLQSFLPQYTQAATASEQYNPWSQLMPYWAALTQTGPQAVMTGQAGQQQFGQTGTTQQTGSMTANALANMLSQGTASGTQSGTWSGTQTQTQPGSILGGLGNIFSMLGGSNGIGNILGSIGNLFGGGGGGGGGITDMFSGWGTDQWGG